MVIFAVDKRDLHGLARQFLGGRQATEAAADDYNLWSFHFSAHTRILMELPQWFFRNRTGIDLILLSKCPTCFSLSVSRQAKACRTRMSDAQQNQAGSGGIQEEAIDPRHYNPR
jgi:hypothetical protein